MANLIHANPKYMSLIVSAFLCGHYFEMNCSISFGIVAEQETL